MWPTPYEFCKRLTICWSTSVETSRRLRVLEYTTSSTAAPCWLSLLARSIFGSRTSRGSVARICATLSRISCVAAMTSVSSRKSIEKNAWLSRAVA